MPLTPAVWRFDETIVDSRSDFQGFSRVAELPDGRFVVAWLDYTDADTDTARVGFRIFNADGTPSTPATFPSQITDQDGIVNATRIDVTGREGGGFAIMLTEDNSGAANTDSRLFNFSETGAYQNSRSLDTTSRDEFHDVAVDNLRDGYIGVSAGSVGGVRFEVNNTTGGEVTTTLPIAANEDQFQPDVAYLGDGRAVVVYVRRLDNDNNTTDIGWDIVSTLTGTVLQSGTVAGSAGDRDDVPAVTALDDGGFAVVFRDFQGGATATDRNLILEIRDADGAFVASSLIEGADDATDPSIASNGGEIVITWEQTISDQLWLQRFDATAAASIGAQVRYNGDVNGFDPDIAVTTDGRYVLSYQLGNSAAADVYYSIYDSREGTFVSSGGQATAPVGGGTLIGGAPGEAESLFGTFGDDTFVVTASSAANTSVDGSIGTDTVDFSASEPVGTVGLFGSLTTGFFSVGPSGNGFILTDIENIIGTASNDIVSGDFDDNLADLSGGDDTWFTTAGNDVVYGGAGIDTLRFDDAVAPVTFKLFDTRAQVFDASSSYSTDTIAASGFENVRGSDLADTITGDLRANILNGLDGNDFLLGAGGDDVLFGNDGDDRLRGGGGNDTLNGSIGSDSADYFGSVNDITVDLGITTGQNTGAGVDTLSSIENVIGGDGNDTFTGDGADNLLIGNAGNDMLFGGAGNDTLRGGTGVNLLDGGDGEDTANFADAAGNVFLSLNNAAQQNTVGGGIVTLVSIENAVGGNGSDTLVGNSGSNSLSGGFGNDVLSGGAGADILEGGRGQDTLTGGAGADVFVFGQLDFRDTITDFQDDTDTIDLTDFGFASVAAAQGFAAQVGADVVYTFTPGPGPTAEVLTVENVTIAALADDLLV